MNDQSQMMNQPQMINPPQIMSQPQVMMNQPPQVPIVSLPAAQLMNHKSPMLNHSQFLLTNQSQVQGIGQPQMMNRSYGMWPPPLQTSMDMMKFPNPMKQGFGAQKPMKPRNWMGKKGNDKRKDGRRKEMSAVVAGGSSSAGIGGGVGPIGGGGGYKPPTLSELQNQNRLKARRFYPKKKYNRFAPFAPRNTTSFIIRAKKSGGIADLVSPCPVTPAVLPTPNFSPSREVLGDMAKEEWGVDGYGSMKGLIRLRSPWHEAEVVNEDEEEEEGGSSESDVEEHLEVERRLDHDLSRFEMIYPNYGVDYNNVLENRVDDQNTHIAQLEEENLLLKERLFLMEREMGDLRRRLQRLERHKQAVEEINEEVVDNVSENESEAREDIRSMGANNDEVVEENEEAEETYTRDGNIGNAPEDEFVKDVHMEEFTKEHQGVNENQDKENGLEKECTGKNSGCGGNDDCIEELARAHPDEPAENQFRDEGEGNECQEMIMGHGHGD